MTAINAILFCLIPLLGMWIYSQQVKKIDDRIDSFIAFMNDCYSDKRPRMDDLDDADWWKKR